MIVDADDVEALLSEVESFSVQRIAVATERPEAAINDETLCVLSAEAAELGIVPGSAADSGFALWEHCDHAGAVSFNLGLLQHVGFANAGVAFAWHRAALARMTAAALGVGPAGRGVLDIALATTGHYGLAQSELGKYLAADTATANGGALPDWLDRHRHPTTLVAPAGWKSVVWPIWHDGRIGWEFAPRDDLVVTRCRAQHGFDELASFGVRRASETRNVVLAPHPDWRRFYERVLKLDMIGLMAIGAGALRRARSLASDYAAIRKQGGKVIAGHPAVQQMLGEIETVQYQVDAMLRRLSRPIDEVALAEVAGLRSVAHAAFCHGANQAVQVHGGIGYMRDAGPEKIVRDQNMLRLQAGGLREIPLLLTGLNGGGA